MVEQIKRVGKWLAKQYHCLKLSLLLAGVRNAEETAGEPTGGMVLCTPTNDRHTSLCFIKH